MPFAGGGSGRRQRPLRRAVTGSSALPSGTLTFLFTDIEDSTLLWERDETTMRPAVAGVSEVLASSIRAHRGHVVKSTGDGIMAVFVDAPSAIDAAVEAQRALATSTMAVPLAVRMGLHSGAAEPTDGDYHAPAVNRAARVAATAHPGQILVSETVAALTDRGSLLDLGEHQLKGLAPMRLHQVVAEGLRRDFPPTAAATLNRLPTQMTSFIGRAAEVEAVGDLLASHRLVTLTGAGGCGETRLAIEVARRRGYTFRDGARFVDLAATADERVVDEAIADALGLAAGLRSTAPRDRSAGQPVAPYRDLHATLRAYEAVAALAAVLAALREDWEQASLLLAASVAVVYRSPADVALYVSFRDRARQALGSRRSRELRAKGRALPLADALHLALGPARQEWRAPKDSNAQPSDR